MRARWLKPEFFTDKKVASMAPITALVYQALWCMADDGGTAPCDPDTIKAQMFYRWSAVGVPEISGAVRHLSELKRITVYRVGDDHFARIESWKEHQQVHKPSKFRNPQPDKGVAVEAPEIPGTSAAPLPASPPPRHLDSQTPRHLDVTPSKLPDGSREFAEAWELYPKRSGSNSKVRASRAYLSRIKAGVRTDELLEGVVRYAAYMRATGKEGTEFVLQAATFFGPDEHWRQSWEIPPAALALRPSSDARLTPGAATYANAMAALENL